jgi:hypothetical protein
MVRVAAFFILFALMMTSLDAFAAQQPADPPSAPVPTPIFTGKKVFISNTSLKAGLPWGTPDLTYNEFYAAMKSWGRYEIVSAPADADLVFEIGFTFVIGPTGVNQGSGGSWQDFQVQVVIRDAKSHIGLWAFSESVKQDGNAAKGRKYFDQAMASLVDDLKNLVAKSPDPAGNQKN